MGRGPGCAKALVAAVSTALWGMRKPGNFYPGVEHWDQPPAPDGVIQNLPHCRGWAGWKVVVGVKSSPADSSIHAGLGIIGYTV